MLLLKMQESWQYWPHRRGWQQLARDELGQLPSGGAGTSQLAQPPPLLLSYTQKALLISDKSPVGNESAAST